MKDFLSPIVDNSIEVNEALSEETRIEILKKDKGGTWYDGWRPYCLKCSTMGRMTQTSYGFICEGTGDTFGRRGCGNKIGWNLERINQTIVEPAK